jgi:large conductance mechanosensitive channel protein
MFKEFAMKGNVIDMAVGIIIGAAFGTIIKDLSVNNTNLSPTDYCCSKMDKGFIALNQLFISDQ